MNNNKSTTGVEKWMEKVDKTLDRVAEGLFMVAEHDKDIDVVKNDVKDLKKGQVAIEKQLIPLQSTADKWKWVERIVWVTLVGALLSQVIK